MLRKKLPVSRRSISPAIRRQNETQQYLIIDSQNISGDESFTSEDYDTPLDDIKTEQEYPLEQEEIENDAFKSEVKRFVEISKFFSSPLRKSASYLCENRLVSHPNPYRIEYKRGSITTQHIKFSNLTLEPVFVRLYKVIPDLEQLKFINLSFSRCKRIPPGLSFNLGFVYDDVNEAKISNAKMVFVASRKSTTPCYQVCEIDMEIDAKITRPPVKT